MDKITQLAQLEAGFHYSQRFCVARGEPDYDRRRLGPHSDAEFCICNKELLPLVQGA